MGPSAELRKRSRHFRTTRFHGPGRRCNERRTRACPPALQRPNELLPDMSTTLRRRDHAGSRGSPPALARIVRSICATFATATIPQLRSSRATRELAHLSLCFAYVGAVEAGQLLRREAKSTEIVGSTMNDTVRLKDHTSRKGPDARIQKIAKGGPQFLPKLSGCLKKGTSPSPHVRGRCLDVRVPDTFGNADLRGSDWVFIREDITAVRTSASCSRLPSRYFPEGEAGSGAIHISDPQDLADCFTRVNGASRKRCRGGHTPAPPVDRDHPL